ncbi:hypothetical protein, partial [Mesorhizobium sp. M7A.F.Ca.CA.004.12.1.1]|uniref:hypothetical protein n=1 Tax=Mesorhizobium sp. M7A.F.Ca.CA.004.12.1.1 TaxID=2496732 RepID=UPI0019D23D0F
MAVFGSTYRALLIQRIIASGVARDGPVYPSFDDALQGRTDGATGAGHSRDFVTSATAVADHCRDGPVRV